MEELLVVAISTKERDSLERITRDMGDKIDRDNAERFLDRALRISISMMPSLP